VPLYMTFILWAFYACVGPNGWFVLATGIKEIFACIEAFCATLAAWIWKNTAALGVSFGKYLYAQLAVDALLDILMTPGCGPQVAGMLVSGLFVSYAVLALGYSVWTFCLCPNTVPQQALSVHGVHVFLPLVLAWIVLGVITFDAEDQGDQKSDGNDEHDNTRDQTPSVNSDHPPIQAAVHPPLTSGNNTKKSPQSGTVRNTGVASGARAAFSRTIADGHTGIQINGDVSALEVTTAEVVGIPSPSAHDNRKRGHNNKIIDLEGIMRGQPSARVSAEDDSAETNDMDTDTG